jgi:hypothetical protein
MRGELVGPVYRCFDALEYIFKFLVQSRILFARWNQGKNEDSFRVDVFGVMEALMRILSSPNQEFLCAQISILKNLPHMVDQLAKVFSVPEIGVLSVGLIQCMPGSNLPNAICDWSSYLRYSYKRQILDTS